jgi:poly(A) polymerase
MQPTIISRDHHTVSRKLMSEEVLKVLYRLHRTGHIAYLCGGGVRDLLLGRDTVDFDVVTDARPYGLKDVFNNCRLVGRRFRIAHIVFKGGKFIEVSTFRKMGEEEAKGDAGDNLLIKRDNTFGSPAEDAFRRDFTINALYYSIADFTIIDYVGGRKDLENRLIRCIGDPDIRFQEDPIRILRGIRLASFLDFEIEAKTWEAMKRQRHHIMNCPTPRIREEIMKILRRGNIHRSYKLLAEAGILVFLFPKLDEFLRSGEEREPLFERSFWRHLAVLDGFHDNNADLSDPLLLATLTATPVLASLEKLPAGHDVGKWMYEYLEEYFKPLDIPRVVRSHIHLLHLSLRHMLAPKKVKRRRSLRRSPLFPDALTFLEIHCRATQQHWPVLQRWQCPPQPQHPKRKVRPKPTVSREKRTS